MLTNDCDNGFGDDRLRMLFDTIAEVSSTLELDELLVRVVDRSVDLTGAERGILLLRDDDGDAAPRVARDRGGGRLPLPVQYSTGAANRVLSGGHPVHLREDFPGTFKVTESITGMGLRNLMCAPLATRGDPIGALYVDSRSFGDREFSQRDFRLFTALADQVAVAIENARLHERALESERLQARLRIAAKIQEDALPPSRLKLPGYDVFGVSKPCDETGGDYFDYLVGGGPEVGLVVGDVTGHGLEAALYMLNARARLRSSLTWEEDPTQVFAHLDRELSREMPSGKFMTLLLATLDLTDRTVRSVSAGHEAPVVLRAGRDEFEQLPGRGAALAMGIGTGWRVSEPCRLDDGDILVLTTDGIPEARAPEAPDGTREMWGERRFHDTIRSLRDGDAETMVNGVLDAVDGFIAGGDPEDDLTLIVVKVDK